MDATFLDTQRRELEQERAQHLEFLDENGADPYSDEVTSLQVGNDGFADAAQAAEERSELLGQIEVSRDRIQRIDEALARMDAGEYGVCVDCGAEIPPARLEARPLAIRCVECAARTE